MMKLLLLGMAIVACQNKGGTEVLAKDPQQAPPSFYGDVTTTKDRRFAFKITYGPDKKPAKILLREINEDDGEVLANDQDCIDEFDELVLSDRGGGVYITLGNKSGSVIRIDATKENEIKRFLFSQKHGNKWSYYDYRSETKGKTANHDIASTSEFDEKYFSDDAKPCEEE